MTRSEKSILNDTLVAASARPRSLFYRQNTGTAWQGKRLRFYPGTTIPVPPGVIVLQDPRPITFGLEGAGDIAGVDDGRPVQIETKTATGPQREQQKRFEAAWTRAGGLYILARSPDEAVSRLTLGS